MDNYSDSDLASLVAHLPEPLLVVDDQGTILYGNGPAHSLGFDREYPSALSAPSVVVDGNRFSSLVFKTPWFGSTATVVLLLPAGRSRILELERETQHAQEQLQLAEERCRRLETVAEAARLHAQRCEARARQLEASPPASVPQPEAETLELGRQLEEAKALAAEREKRLGELTEELGRARDQADRLKERIWEIRHESSSSGAELQRQVQQLKRELAQARAAADRTGTHDEF